MVPVPSHLGPGVVGDARGTQGPLPPPARPWRGRGRQQNPTLAPAVLRRGGPGLPPPRPGSSGARCRPTMARHPTRQPRGARPRLSHGTGRGLRRGGPCSGLPRPRGGGLRWRKVCGVAGGGGGAAVPSRFLYFFLHTRLPPPSPLSGRSGA